LSGQVDYNNSQSQTHVVRTAGYLTDCTISVSINSTTAGNVDTANISRHVARAAGIVGVVNPTTGEEYLGDRISVIAMPFYEPPAVLPIDPSDPQEMWIIYAAIAGVVLFLLLLIIIILVLRRKKKKKLQAEEEARQAELLAAGGVEDIDAFLAAAAGAVQGDGEDADMGANVMSIQTERSVELRQEIRKFAEENPEIAAQMVKAWLKGDEE
jgi:flagellar M-ring protein FliF